MKNIIVFMLVLTSTSVYGKPKIPTIAEWKKITDLCEKGKCDKLGDMTMGLYDAGYCFGEKGQPKSKHRWHVCNNNSLESD